MRVYTFGIQTNKRCVHAGAGGHKKKKKRQEMKECAFSHCWDSNVSGDVCVTRRAPFPWTNLISLTSYTVVIGGLFVEQLIILYKSQYHCLKSERFYTSPAQLAYSRALFCRQMACLHVWCMWLFSPFSVLLILLYPADQRQRGAWAWAWSCSRSLPVKRDFFSCCLLGVRPGFLWSAQRHFWLKLYR